MDLAIANLREADLGGADLERANLSGMDLAVLLAGKSEYAMFVGFRRRYSWVLATHYTSPEHLIADLGERVIAPAEAKVRELRG